MSALHLSLEIPVTDGAIGIPARLYLTQLWLGCASLLWTAAVVQRKLLHPFALVDSLFARNKRVARRHNWPAPSPGGRATPSPKPPGTDGNPG
jgi:hypothetical protein